MISKGRLTSSFVVGVPRLPVYLLLAWQADLILNQLLIGA
jgi:hypothetical protein